MDELTTGQREQLNEFKERLEQWYKEVVRNPPDTDAADNQHTFRLRAYQSGSVERKDGSEELWISFSLKTSHENCSL